MKKKEDDKNADKKKRFLGYFKTTPIQKFAAGFIGMSEDTIGRWKKTDKDFADCIEVYKSEYVSKELNLVRSREWKLERIFKGDFAQRTEVTGKDGEDLKPLVIIKDNGSKTLTVADESMG